MKTFQEKDVVKIISGKSKGRTGVVLKNNRGVENMSCVVTKGHWLGIWHFNDSLKKIGSTKRKKVNTK